MTDETEGGPALEPRRANLGIAGRLAGAFVDSKLTPLVILASLALGVLAVVVTPREEEPQIKVPMVDLFAPFPGASAQEVERLVTIPLEKAFASVPGLEYVYSTSSPGMGMLVLRFKVGEEPDRALVRVRAKLDAIADTFPAGAGPVAVKPRSIDDVPVYALTIWTPRGDPIALRRLASELEAEVKTVPEVAETELIGGRSREVRVEVDPALLAARGLSISQVVPALQAANRTLTAGSIVAGGRSLTVEAGGFFRSAEDVGRVVLATSKGRPVTLRDVARIIDGPAEASQYVTHAEPGTPGLHPAVTLAVSKRLGANAIDVVRAVEKKIDLLRPRLVAGGIRTTVTRNYGETAADKSNQLLEHMGIATLSVALLIAWALGRREAGIVLLAIPVTLSLTLFSFLIAGYTLNRITLFALIFSIGILVDDAIVVVENIVRHLRLPGASGRPLADVAVEATNEVGNPTILATFAVIAAIVPMAFVGGLMGPYMLPIPFGASAAMLFSLLVAFTVTPWAARRILVRAGGPSGHGEDHEHRDDALTRLYKRVVRPLLQKEGTGPRALFFVVVGGLLLASIALVPLGVVIVKMLPFDNKVEFQVVVDLPEGTPLETTHQALAEMAAAMSSIPEVRATTVYAGTAAPYNFNGLVRHYFLRSGPHQGDVQVTLAPKGERSRSSHAIAKEARPLVAAVGQRYDAHVKVAEVPPGPPVLQTIVAEIYGPSDEGRRSLAARVMEIFKTTDGVVDVDWYVERPHEKAVFVLDREKAARSGLHEAEVAALLRVALGRDAAGLLHVDTAREPVAVVVTLPSSSRNDLAALAAIRVATPGGLVPLGELGRFETRPVETSLYRKNLKPVVYVTADVAGKKEAPAYVMGTLTKKIEALELPGGQKVETMTPAAPFDTGHYGLKWDGEWHVTYEVFRDMGLAFAAVLVLIYVLVVGWFKSFMTPIVIMAPIPLTLVGILPAHGLFGVFFTATSMIGFIAGAGIIVRNSIILVDFIELRRSQGYPLSEAVLDAGAVRFRPMLLTAAAVVVGTSVMLMDPIFQGLAVAMMAGEVASTVLSRFAVPVLYYLAERGGEKDAVDLRAQATPAGP